MGVVVEGKRNNREDVIEVWECPQVAPPELPDWEAWGGNPEKTAPDLFAERLREGQAPSASILADFEKRIEEQAQLSLESGRAKGVEQGRAAERAAQAPLQQGLAAQIERILESFASERDRYLQSVEHEVVKLALAVAARILRREAQMDPLLLTGAVRVALGQLAASTVVRLRVPEAELDLWSESIAHLPNLPVRPQVVLGDGMRLGDCMLEAELGTVDLGVRAQLSEIERGFFDRATSAASAPERAMTRMEQ